MKTCFKCNVKQPLSEFYRHPQMGDGHLNKCKECAKRDVRENRKEKVDYYREYDKDRAMIPKRVQGREDYYNTKDGRLASIRAKQKWLDTNTVKRSTHILVKRAIKKGVLARPLNCSECGAECKAHGHHDDYAKPLDVRWLCSKCHRHWHKHNEALNGF